MQSRTARNIGITFIISGVMFITLGVVLLAAGGSALNFVTIGGGAIQIMSGVSLTHTAKKMEEYDV